MDRIRIAAGFQLMMGAPARTPEARFGIGGNEVEHFHIGPFLQSFGNGVAIDSAVGIGLGGEDGSDHCNARHISRSKVYAILLFSGEGPRLLRAKVKVFLT